MGYAEELFVKGGPVMWPLLVCSIVSLTLTVERLIFWVRQGMTRDDELTSKVFSLTERCDYDGAIAAGRESGDVSVRVLVAGLEHKDHGLAEVMEMQAYREVGRMKKGLAVLDTIITMAPMLGILGTVTGIIKSFNLLGASGIDDPRAATSGLAEALITTAAGLIVALITLVPFNYFVARAQAASRMIEQTGTQFQMVYRKSIGKEA